MGKLKIGMRRIFPQGLHFSLRWEFSQNFKAVFSHLTIKNGVGGKAIPTRHKKRGQMGIFTFKNFLRFPPKADLAFRWEFQAFLKFLFSHEGLKNSSGGKIFPRSLVFEALWESGNRRKPKPHHFIVSKKAPENRPLAPFPGAFY